MGLLGKIWVKLGLDNSEFKQGLNDSQNASNKFKDFIKGVGQGIIAAFSVQAVIQFGKEIFKLASAAQGVEMAFKRIAPQGLLSDLRRATMNSVDDMQLMQRTVQASNFKIPLEQLATYLQFATKRALETGQSVDYLVDSIITGLGRQSVMILDNLGLSAAEIRTQMEGGATMAEAVGNIINQDLSKGNSVIETAATNSAQLATAWTNFKTELGQSILGIGKLEKALADTLRYLSSSGGNVSMLDLVKAIINPNYLKKLSEQSAAYGKMQEEARKYAEEQMKGIASVEEAEARLLKIEGFRTAKYDELRVKLREYISANKEVKEVVEEVGEAEIKAREGSIKALEEQISKLKEKISLETDSGPRAALQQELKNMEYRLSIMKLTTDELKLYNDLMARSGRGAPALPAMTNTIEGQVTMTTKTDPFKETLAQGEDALDQMESQMKRAEAMSQDFNQTISRSVAEGIGTLVESLVATGKVDTWAVVSALLTPFADLAIQLGTMAIATGIGVDALKASFATGGAGAVAAGIALVALGAAVKGGLAGLSRRANGGSSASYSYGTGGGGVTYAGWQPQMASQSVELNLTGVLKGQDIYLAVEKAKNNRLR